MRGSRGVARGILLTVGAGAAAFGFAEAALRVFPTPVTYMYSRAIVQNQCARPDSLLQFRNREGYVGTFRNREFTTAIRTNARGLRDRAIPYERAAGTIRCLALGDSYTFGWGVEADETFAKRLERTVPRLEVVNAGCSGWSTRQEVDFLATEGRLYRPDIVLLCFAENDPYENGLRYRFANGELRDSRTSDSGAAMLKRAVLRVSRVAGVLAQARAAASSTGSTAGTRARMWNDEIVEIRRAVDLCRSADARLAILYVAPRRADGPAHGEWYEPLSRECARDGVPLIDPTAALVAAHQATPVYFRLDEHWATAGHRVVARVLADWLTRAGWLQAALTPMPQADSIAAPRPDGSASARDGAFASGLGPRGGACAS